MLKLRFANKEHGDVWLVEPAVLLGTDSSCQVMLKRDGVQPRHIEVLVKGDELQLVNLSNDANLTVNGKRAEKQQPLQIGDELSLAGMTLIVIDPKAEPRASAPGAATPESSGWAIRPNHSALANKTYTINGDTTLGRSAECDLSFSVTHLSRKHAQLSIVRGNLMVKDLGSANGTYVNGKRVEEAKLERGDELRLDTLSFTVIGPGGEADKTTLRAAISVPSAAPVARPAAPSPAADSDNTEAEKERKRVAGTTAFNRAVTASEEAKQEAAKPDGINWIMVIIALFAIAGVVLYYVLG